MRALFFLLLSALSFAAPLQAADTATPPLPKIFFSVDSTVNQSKEWAKNFCQRLHGGISKVAPYDAQCSYLANFDELGENPIDKAEKSGQFLYHVQVREREANVYKVFVENWSAQDEGEFKKVGWTIKAHSPEEAREKIDFLLSNVANYQAHKSTIKAFYLGGGLSNSKVIKVDRTGTLLIASTNKPISDEEGYQEFIKENSKNKNYLRAMSEIGIALGFGAINYWSPTWLGKPNKNAEDWDFYGWKGQKDRILEGKGFRFDDNSRGVNTGHAYAGMVYYQIARANNLNTMEAFMYNFAASSVWEVLNEHREVISINDQLVTIVGGFAIGEALHQFGLYFYAKNTIAGKALSTIFDAPTAINRLLDGNLYNSRRDSLRSYGFDPNAFGYMGFFAGTENSNKRGDGKTYGMHGELYTIPLYDSPGAVRNLYTDTVFSELLVKTVQRPDAMSDYQALAKVVFAAYHQKQITLDSQDRKNGYTFFIGLSSAAEAVNKNAKNGNDPTDWMATVHVLGTSMNMQVFYKNVKIRMGLDVYGDFAMVRSFALDNYRETNPIDSGEEATLRRHEYYYASGITFAANLGADLGGLSIGYALRQSTFQNISGYSRYQEQVTKDLAIADRATTQEVYAAYGLTKNWQIKVSVESSTRSGTINNSYSDKDTETRTMGSIIYLF